MRSALRAGLFGFAVGLACVLTVASGCSGVRADCNPAECSGCCDSEGICQPGFLDGACGTGGAACTVCTSPLFCGNGACFSPGGGGGGPGTDGGTVEVPADRLTAVCQRWRDDRMDRDEGTWTGDVASCEPGDNPTNRVNALKILNLYRFLADLPAVTTDASRDARAQACALMMLANGRLSHNPTPDWTCHTPEGAQAAGASNISSRRGVAAVDSYMVDSGNATTLGHRRWILSPRIGPVGLGSASSYSCMWVTGGSMNVSRDWVAWPPEGPFPIDAFGPSSAITTHDTGWSIQSDTIDLTEAQITVTRDGQPLSVSTTVLERGYGSTTAVRFNPQGWQPEAGRSYRVFVENVTPSFTYVVEVVECP